MPYMNSIERRALARGIEEGIEQGMAKGLEKGLAKGIEKGLEKGLAKGIEKGMAKGIEKGAAKGRIEQLQRLLEHRFGPLPEWSLEKLGQGNPSLLDSWALRIFDARRLEDVFN